MAYIVRMPKLGYEMESGTVVDWFVQTGDDVRKEEVLAEIETEKTVAEIEARENGVLRTRFLEVGEEGPPGIPMAIVAPADEDISGLESQAREDLEEAAPSEPAESPAKGSEHRSRETDREPEESTAPESDEVQVTPRGRMRAQELGVDPAGIEGTGYQGSVTADDVERFASEQTLESSGRSRTIREERSPGEMRRTIANRLSQSYREAVHVTVHRKVPADTLMQCLEEVPPIESHPVSPEDFLLMALSDTLREHPAFNATFEEETHRIYEDHHICVAVDVEDGLLAPVLSSLQDRDLPDLVLERHRVVNAVRKGQYTMEDLQGGTFTVSNLGVLGVESFDPIINPPQVAILGVGSLLNQPRRRNDELAWERVLPLDLSFDHRVVDGADAARFLDTLTECISEADQYLPG